MKQFHLQKVDRNFLSTGEKIQSIGRWKFFIYRYMKKFYLPVDKNFSSILIAE